MFSLIIAIINKIIVQQVSIKYFISENSITISPTKMKSTQITRNMYLNL